MADILQSLAKQTNLTQPYLTAGDRAYIIGNQDGDFPDFGWHIPGEMSGVWSHPIKLLDGFWLQVDGAWLTPASRFVSGPFWSAHEYDVAGLHVIRRQFVPDGQRAVVVRYTFQSPSARTLRLRLIARADLQGAWLAERDSRRNGFDHASFLDEPGAWLCRDDCSPWYAIVGARDLKPVAHDSGRDLWGPQQTSGNGISVALDYEVVLSAGTDQSVEFVIAGSDDGAASALATFERVVQLAGAMWEAKKDRYHLLLSHSALHIDDPTIMAAWDWIKCNYDWLVCENPVWGRGLLAGAQDYVQWFGCDNAYALLGCLALGQHDVAIDTLDLLRRLSEARNGDTGRMIHEASTHGMVFNPGNSQETPQLVSTVWQTFLWTGDLDFLRRSYSFCRRGLLEWTLAHESRGDDPWPYGYGIIEVEYLNQQCIDTAAHTVTALDALAGMAEVLGDSATAARCRPLTDQLRARLDQDFWLDKEGVYGDMRATPAEMIPRFRQWIERAKDPTGWGGVRPQLAEAYQRLLQEAEADPHQERPRTWLCGHWTILAPLETGLATPEHAQKTLDFVTNNGYIGRWGMYLNGYSQHAMMSINTGVLATAAVSYGRIGEGIDHIRTIAETLEMHMPGAISEMSPDEGCFVQAWSGYGIAWTMIAGVFGLRPDAWRKHLVINPTFPSGWTHATLSGVRVGTTTIDLTWDGTTLTAAIHEPGWSISSNTAALHVATV